MTNQTTLSTSENRCPSGRPAAHGSTPAKAPDNGTPRPIAAPKQSPNLTTSPTPAEPVTPAKPASGTRVGRTQLRTLEANLTERDRHLLALLARHRFLSAHHVRDFTFNPDHGATSNPTAGRAARRATTRLYQAGLIQPVTPRRVGGLLAGAAPTIWQLTSAGQRLTHPDGQRHRISEPSRRFLTHNLAIAHAHLAALRTAQQLDGNLSVAIEKEAFRAYPNLGGGSNHLRPDLYIEITASDTDGQYVDRWFIEVDCGTESIPTLLRKAEQYQTYRSSGIEQTRYPDTAGVFPLVLWIMSGDRAHARTEQLTAQIRRTSRIPSELFRYATTDTTEQTLTSGGQP